MKTKTKDKNLRENRKLIELAITRLAEIFVSQMELNKNKNNYERKPISDK